MGKEFYLPNGLHAVVKSISFSDSGDIDYVVFISRSHFLVTLPNTKTVKPKEMGFDDEGNINFVKLPEDEITIIDLPYSKGKKIKVTEIGFNKEGHFTSFKLAHGEKIDIELPNNIIVKVTQVIHYDTGEIKDVFLLYGEYLIINGEKVKVEKISFYITGKIKKINFFHGEYIILNNNRISPQEIEYYENGEVKYLLLEENQGYPVIIPKTKEKIMVSSVLFYSSMELSKIKPISGEIVTLPNGRQIEVTNISFDEYGNIDYVKLYNGEIVRFEN